MDDAPFAQECRERFEKGFVTLDQLCWREDHGYYVPACDPQPGDEPGLYHGCHIDQLLGQSCAFQIGLGRVMNEKHNRQALQSLWRYSVTPNLGPFLAVNKPSRWYALPGEGGMPMNTFPFGNPPTLASPLNECLSGCEWQVASHMLWEGLVTEGLAVARLIHDRYHAKSRNPYNELEGGDHSPRAMAS